MTTCEHLLSTRFNSNETCHATNISLCEAQLHVTPTGSLQHLMGGEDGPHSCRTQNRENPPSRRMKRCREGRFLLFFLGPVLGTWVPESGPERPGPQAQRRSRAQSCLPAGGWGGWSSSFPVQDAARPPARQGPLLGHPCVAPLWGLRESARTHLPGTAWLGKAFPGLCTRCSPTLRALYHRPTQWAPLQPPRDRKVTRGRGRSSDHVARTADRRQGPVNTCATGSGPTRAEGSRAAAPRSTTHSSPTHAGSRGLTAGRHARLKPRLRLRSESRVGLDFELLSRLPHGSSGQDGTGRCRGSAAEPGTLRPEGSGSL